MVEVTCPKCDTIAETVETIPQDETALSFVVAQGGDILAMDEETAVEYEFQPCGHTFPGTVK